MSESIMDIKKDEFKIEIDYSDTKRLNFYDTDGRDGFDIVDFECPSCNKKSYIRGHFEYSFGMYFYCNECCTEVEFDTSQVKVNVYAKFTNLKALKVCGIYNYNADNE